MADADTQAEQAPLPDKLNGTVTRSTGSFYRVELSNGPHAGQEVDATLRGKFRLREGIKTNNPLAVGDRVELRPDEHGYLITELHPRTNYILRRSTRKSAQAQILCANIDRGVFIATLQQPFTPLSYLDAFLVMCEAYHIPVVIVFNKVDLLEKDKDLDKLEDFFYLYSRIGYSVVTLDAWAEHTPATMQKILQGRTSFLAGRSGSGKSTLINKADPSLELKTADISDYSQKGRHTTTYAERHKLAFGGYVIDAPGFSEFLPVDLKPSELAGYFRDFRPLLDQCRFANCLHLNEPDCAIHAAVEAGELAESRYNTYQKLLTTLREQEKLYGPG